MLLPCGLATTGDRGLLFERFPFGVRPDYRAGSHHDERQ